MDARTTQLRREDARRDLLDCRRGVTRPARRLLDRRRLGIERKRMPALALDGFERGVEFRLPLLPAERFDQELHPVALLVLVIAQLVEDAYDGFGRIEHLRDRQELEQHAARLAHDRSPAARQHTEAAAAVLD